MYYNRLIDSHLLKWRNELNRKPLLLRGPRQVGKSSAVRQLGQLFESMLEINFEESPSVKSLFEKDLTPDRIVENLSILYNVSIVPGKTLLFFDEVQSCPQAISALRFFYEKMPALHVVAAGSLLEFALQELPSYGVGRVRSLFVYPFSFDEFLVASGENLLVQAKQHASADNPLPDAIHQKLLDLLKRFMVVGGMPDAVAAYIGDRDIMESQKILDDLYFAFKTDFAKYKNRVSTIRLIEVFESVVRQSGGKFMYAKASIGSSQHLIKEGVEMLMMAGLVIPVTHTAANGLPLGAESDPKKRKMMLFDTGIFQRILGLNLSDFLLEASPAIINKGAIAEMFFGLEYLKYGSPFTKESLHYWHRESAGSNAEVDYVIQQGADMVPIEVKSSGKGSMQSLRQFLKQKSSKYGYRISLENFSTYEDIRVIPLYAVSNLFQ